MQNSPRWLKEATFSCQGILWFPGVIIQIAEGYSYSSPTKPYPAIGEVCLTFSSLAYRAGHWVLIISPSAMFLPSLASHSPLFSFLYVVTLKYVFKSVDTPPIKSNSLPLEYELALVTDFSQIEFGRSDDVWHPGLDHKGQYSISLDSLLGHLLLESSYRFDPRPHGKTSCSCSGQ